ncbi:ATP-binding protein [Arthrobacter sp. TMN-37]
MTEVLAQRVYQAPATPAAIDDLHAELDAMWESASFVPALDQMAFTTAVIEAASNVVQHSVAAPGCELRLAVTLTVMASVLQARISEVGAVPAPEMPPASLPDDDQESGRGLALIEALTTITVELRGETKTWVLSREIETLG